MIHLQPYTCIMHTMFVSMEKVSNCGIYKTIQLAGDKCMFVYKVAYTYFQGGGTLHQ